MGRGDIEVNSVAPPRKIERGDAMRRWVAGSTDIPAGGYVDLLRLATERAVALDQIAERLRIAG